MAMTDNWIYVEPNDDGGCDTVVVNRAWLIMFYWDYWSKAMKRAGKEELISEENCIEDWAVVNWATRTRKHCLKPKLY